MQAFFFSLKCKSDDVLMWLIRSCVFTGLAAQSFFCIRFSDSIGTSSDNGYMAGKRILVMNDSRNQHPPPPPPWEIVTPYNLICMELSPLPHAAKMFGPSD